MSSIPFARELSPPAETAAGRAPRFHLPSLDGIRAVAALVVFFSHAGWGHLIPGGLGVTIFFFLSGYLITTLLRREYAATGKLHLGHFYLRRAWRILPPMYIVLLSAFALGLAGVVPDTATPGGLASQLLQVSNYYWVYVGDAGLVYGTNTFWSLAVEEHFYLLYPLLLLALLKGASRQSPLRVLVILCALGLAWRCLLVFGFNVTEQHTYLSTDTRFDSLLYGCILGVWHNPALDDQGRDLPPAWRVGGVVLGAALVLATLAVRDGQFRETLRYSLQGMAFLPLFWLAVRYPRWWPFAALNWAPMVWLGRFSYTFYLVHFIVIKFFNFTMRPVPAAVAAFGVSVGLAALMYFMVERPCARLRARLHD